MSLEPVMTHASTVVFASRENPSLHRVTPAEPDNSYMVHKIVGGPAILGNRKPRGGPALSSDEISRIRAWILAGAAND